VEIKTQKPFEKPEGGAYIGTIIDVVEKPQVPTTFNGVTKLQDQITFVWVLNYMNGQLAVDSEGRPYQVFETYNAFISDNSKFSKAMTQILNAPHPLINNSAQIEQLFLGRSSGLYITKTPKVGKPAEFTVKVVGHSPLQIGQIAPVTPAGFVRFKNRTKNQAGPQPGQATATYAQPPAQQPTNAVNLNTQGNPSTVVPANVPTATGSPVTAPTAAPQNEAF
jgi:hypothetical protein